MWETIFTILKWLSVPLAIILVLIFLFDLIAVFTPHKDIRAGAERNSRKLEDLGVKYLDLIGYLIKKIFIIIPFILIIILWSFT